MIIHHAFNTFFQSVASEIYQQTGAQFTMDRHRGANDVAADFIDSPHAMISAISAPLREQKIGTNI